MLLHQQLITELKAFLGLLNYYNVFTQFGDSIATTLCPVAKRKVLELGWSSKEGLSEAKKKLLTSVIY